MKGGDSTHRSPWIRALRTPATAAGWLARDPFLGLVRFLPRNTASRRVGRRKFGFLLIDAWPALRSAGPG